MFVYSNTSIEVARHKLLKYVPKINEIPVDSKLQVSKEKCKKVMMKCLMSICFLFAIDRSLEIRPFRQY